MYKINKEENSFKYSLKDTFNQDIEPDPKSIYIFWGKEQKDGFFRNFFCNDVMNRANALKNSKQIETETSNHIGLLFFDKKGRAFVAEVDYFKGGKIISTLQEDRELYIYPIAKNSIEHISIINKMFNDTYTDRGLLYSLKRYDFQDCLNYLYADDEGGQKRLLSIAIFLQNIFSLSELKEKKYTCISLAFEYLNTIKSNIFNKKDPPYVMMYKLNDRINNKL